MDGSNPSSGSPDKKSNAESDGKLNANANTPSENDGFLEILARRVQESLSMGKRHAFWETQPVGQFKDLGDTSLPEGPIELSIPISEVKQEPYNLPNL
ncbi:hypothetical protein AAC387_Pa07g1038 [Persea americana]